MDDSVKNGFKIIALLLLGLLAIVASGSYKQDTWGVFYTAVFALGPLLILGCLFLDHRRNRKNPSN